MASTEVPRADQNGGDLRLFELLRIMAGRHLVDFYPFLDPSGTLNGERYAEALREIGVRILPAGWVHGLERALLRRVYDAAFFEFWTSAELGGGPVRRIQPWAKVIVDSVDIHFRREGHGLTVGVSDEATVERNKARELATYRAADAVVCVSEEEARILEAEGGISRPGVIPVVVPGRERPARDRLPELLFLGGFHHAPNLDGLSWFALEVWPSVRSEVPGARLVVVGSNPTAEVERLGGLDGIEVVGRVPETGPYLERASLMVAPLRYGAGMKTKVVEAMASGLTVVTTSVGAQGLDAVSGEHLMIADSPAGFAGSVVELLADPPRADRLGRAGRSLVEPLCSPSAIARRLEAMLAEVVGRGGPRLPPPDWLARAAGYQARRACARAARSLGVLPRSPRSDRAPAVSSSPS